MPESTTRSRIACIPGDRKPFLVIGGYYNSIDGSYIKKTLLGATVDGSYTRLKNPLMQLQHYIRQDH